MSDNSKRIKKIYKYMNNTFSKLKNRLEKALEKLEWPMELFFMSLTNEIILELEKINTDSQTPKKHKKISSNISNNNIYIEKTGKTYLYQMISMFDEVKIYKNNIPEDIIKYIITPENIQKILQILMATNKIVSTNSSILKERNEFNSYIMNLLINIINLSNKILIDVLSSQSQFNVFYQLFTLFSKSEENRNLLYELERNIFMYYPDDKNLKELINYTIDCIDEELNKNSCPKIITEIKKILYIYKNEINIINKMMMKLIIKIFSLFEDEIEKNNLINDFLKFCFNEISFDGNNKYYSRYIFASANKSKTILFRNSNLTLEKLPDNANNEKEDGNIRKDALNHKTSINSNISLNSNMTINNLVRGNTIAFNNINDIEKQINSKNIKQENKENKEKKENNNNKIINNKEESNNIINNNILNEEVEEKNKYNAEFLNFLFDIYSEFINLKMKQSYNIFFSELFQSINNSSEGKIEYEFLIKNTNYEKIILSSLFKLKDHSLIAAYFSKIISLSLPSNNKDNKKNQNEYFIYENDLNFFINNINLFFDDSDNGEIFFLISSQILSLIKMNKNIIEIILNKCNIFESFLSIINNKIFKSEVKKSIIEFLEKILKINNNIFKYSLNIPIKTYNISDNNLIRKIYILSLAFENKKHELNNKIVLITNYMDSIFKQYKIDELIIFFDILLEGIYRNIIKSSNFQIIDDESINKINTILYDISQLTRENIIINYRYYEELFFILLNFEYNYNKKHFLYYLNHKTKDNKNKIIIEENLLYKIINNFLINEEDFNTKIYILNLLFIYCLDIKDNNEKRKNEEDKYNDNDNYDNYLLKAPNILVNIINILYERKEYQCLNFFITKLIILMKNCLLNIKILINNKSFISLVVKLYIKLYYNKNEENLVIKINMLLNDLSKYLSKTLLIQYLNEIYFIFYTALTAQKDDINYYNKNIILDLFNILKNGIINSKKNNYDYISLSNFCFYNPYIYNLFYINDLKFDSTLYQFLCINMNIRISTYNNIENFNLVEFINIENEKKICFTINNDKKMIVFEYNSKNNNIKENILEINNFNEILNDDGNFHKVVIIINTKTKNIYFQIDQEKIQLNDNKNNAMYKLFEFNELEILIGYKSESIKSKYENKKCLSNIPIIDINNILITRFNNEEEYNLVINKKRKLFQNEIISENINKNKYYFKKNKDKNVEDAIIADINFKNKNINIIKSDKIQNEFNSLDEFIFNNKINNKYISYFNIYNPSNINTINSCYTKVYLFSLINNIEEYYSLNNSNKRIIYNINHKYIQDNIFDNYNISFSACNYYFIDYLFSFIFDIEKRRKNLNQNNEEYSNDGNIINEIKTETTINTPLLQDSFITDFILLIFEIIVELPEKDIIDYFLYKNDIFSIKLKIFFQRNIYILNESNEFAQKLFNDLLSEEKNSISEEKVVNSQHILSVIMTEIFLDLIIFQKLNSNTQNIILINLLQILYNNKIKNQDNSDNRYDILYKILKQLYNIILYYELSMEQIQYNLNEENEELTQIDIIIKCINILMNEFISNQNKIYLNKISDLNNNIIKFYINLNENKQTHNINNFIEEHKSYINYNFINNDIIPIQLQKVISLISKYEIKKESNDSFIEIDLNSEIFSNENNSCYFCSYIKNYFKIKFDNIYNDIKFDKIIDNNYINIFLNCEPYRQTLGIKNYAWFLSRNESNHKVQNKFFLKKNDIKQTKDFRKRINGECYSYKYLYDKEKYNFIIKYLYEIFLLDKISIDFNLFNTISGLNNKEFNNSNNYMIENCLYIKTIHKTLSIIILLKEYILILTNICVDNNKKLHVVKNEIDGTVWCLEKEEYKNELEQYISKNEQNIIKELFNGIENNKNNKIKGFGYNNSFKFSCKKLYYKNISEMHRVSFLTVPNSIEIFMSNGKSYFLCLNINEREKIYMGIISNINEIYKNKDKKLEGYNDFFLKKNNKNIISENFYMKHCPMRYLENNSKEYTSSSLFSLKKSARKKTSSLHNTNLYYNISNKYNYNEAIITTNAFLSEITDLWTKNKVSNYDYVMFLNIISGRSLNNLSQYFIFPRMFSDYNHNILNWISSSIYRDLSYPILSSEPSIRDEIKNKYNLLEGERYHSGTFYSTYAFIAYYMIRQRPFSEISLEIQGGEFDTTDRLFIGAKFSSKMKEKYQESIPFLMTLPELYINNNKFKFGKTQKDGKIVNDFLLPNWSKDDPRKFTLVVKKIMESRNVNAKLNKWFDLIFGIAQSGPEAVKCLNIYRKACYELSMEEIVELKKNFELLAILIEKQELGYNAKQIFKNKHKKKENLNEYKEYENMFFDTNLKLRKIKFIKIKNIEYEKEKNDILFDSINDFIIDIENDYINNTNINNSYQGGIASLKSIVEALNDNNTYNVNQKNNPLKIINILEKENKFIILGNGYHFLGKNFDFILSYNNKYLEITNFKHDIYYCYYLNESNNISTLITNDKGNKIYIAFDNGNIFEYKITFKEEESINENTNINKDSNVIYPFIKANTVDKSMLKFQKYYMYNFIEENLEKRNTLKRSDTKKPKKKQKNEKQYSPPIIILQKNLENNFSFNNPHIPEKIVKIKLNEEHNVLIALTVSNIIYLISLNNKFKLMHIVTYYNKYRFQCKIKDIITFPNNGDFLIYSSITVHLFSINGVPLCELNLLDKVNESIQNITYCKAVFLYDVILFTGHEDFSVIIWKVRNKNTLENFSERVSYVYNNNKSTSFLNEYYYNYDFDKNDSNYNYNIEECELKRKFEIVSQIKMEEDLNINNLSINFMKMSQDMSYMIILDNLKNIYILSNFDDYKEENNNNNNVSNNANLNSNNNTGMFGYFKEKKRIYCISCCKEIIEDNFYRASRVQSMASVQTDNDDLINNSISNEEVLYNNKIEVENDNLQTSNNEKEESKESKNNSNKENNYICEECKLKLVDTESYLYNY